MVLVQYQWPKQEETFASILTTIQKRRKLDFPEFFRYVVSIRCLIVRAWGEFRNDGVGVIEIF